MIITRLKLEEILNPDEVPLLSNLECPIDNLITLNPFICNKCETVFCNECIDQWKKSSNECPTCRSKPIINVQLDKHILNTQITKIKIKCPNSRYGCKDIVKVNNFTINNEYCRFNQMKCNKCSSMFQTGLQINHLVSECEFFKLNCIFCSCEFSLQTIIEHISTCFKENEKKLCKYCFKTHTSDICKEKLEVCEKCNLPDSHINFNKREHVCSNDSIAVANHLRNVYLKLNKNQSEFVIEIDKKFIQFQDAFSRKKREIDKIYIDIDNKLKQFLKELSKEEEYFNKKNKGIRRNHTNGLKEDIKDLNVNINEIENKMNKLDKENTKILEKLNFEYNKQFLIIKNEIYLTKYLLHKIHPNLIPVNEGKLTMNQMKHVNQDNTSSISCLANTVCYICNKYIGNNNVNKCEKCLLSFCDNCKFICKSNDTSHKNVFCKKCSVKCCLCESDEYCLKCVKYCKSKKCSNIVCLNCHKPNKHLYYENCNTINCKDCEKKSLCIITSFFCSHCNERFCNKCFTKFHQHKISK